MEADLMNWLETFDQEMPTLYQESVLDVIERVMIAIRRILSKMKADGQQIKRTIMTEAKRIGLPAKLRRLKKDLIEQKSLGKVTVTAVDYKAFVNCYEKHCGSITMKLNALSDIRKYKDHAAFKKKVEKLGEEIEELDNKLTQLEQHPIQIPTIELISFIERELDGDSKVYYSFIRAADKLQEAQIQYERYLRDSKAFTDDYLETKHVGFIKRLIDKFVSALSKHLSKFVGLIVFRFS